MGGISATGGQMDQGSSLWRDKAGTRVAPVGPKSRALVAAMRILETEGPAGLQLRQISHETGASIGSLYYHFRNKDDLLTQLAGEGFRRLIEALESAVATPAGPPRFRAASAAYLEFVRRKPHLYTLMYSDPMLIEHQAIRDAEKRAFEVYRHALEGHERVPPSQVENVATTFWVLGRGIASLTLQRGASDDYSAGDFTDRVFRGMRFLMAGDKTVGET